jgi:hypothetical protein
MAIALEFLSQLNEVIDFAVEDKTDLFLGICHGLMPTFQVYDRQPPESETHGPTRKIPLVVRTPMGQGSRHSLKVLHPGWTIIRKVVFSADAAHVIRSGL